ncbi:type II toxin-antitoxin system prevent-host-death family antitoxin [Lichenicoccus sp.]|uniref:type II toxin-antitoxin system prevent-host-death family antitoxin n=1 Tax=Lichenicoccus sp. TaxID=2781899 RepID=UPI003D0E16E0
MQRFTTADLNRQVGAITDAAMRAPVVITHHRRPRFVLMSVDEYERLAKTSPSDPRTHFTLEDMPQEIEEGLLGLSDQYEREHGHDG